MRNGSTPSSEFVGRDAELGVLDGLLEALGSGEGGVVYITGAPGMGKTALIAETLNSAEVRGYTTLSGRAAEFERDLPFGVLADALGPHLGLLTPERLSLSDDELALLAAALPSLAPAAAGHTASTQPDDRHRLLHTLRALFGELAADGPLVVAVDDLHWADSASVDFVCHSLHRGLEGPVLLVLASRPAQSESRLLTALEEAERHDLARRIELAPLPVADAAKLVGDGIELTLRQAL